MPARSARRIAVRDETLRVGGTDVETFVVESAGVAARAGVLFLHWLGERHSDRTQFLPEARLLAREGVRCVLPNGRLPWGPDPVDAGSDAANIELEIRRLTAALERLRDGLPSGTPIAVVGHDFGAMYGTLLVARSQAFDAAVLVALTPRFGDWFLRFWKVAGDRFEYLRRLAPLDPIAAAPGLPPRLLYQFSSRDYFIAPMSALELVRASPGEARVEWYGADHEMRSPKARADRLAFLREALGIA